jgi:hypothetical protein
MRADDLFAIDVTAEVATLCGAQLQGSWQVPAEVVRLANSRGAPRVVIDRARGGIRMELDGAIASAPELTDVVIVFDESVRPDLRQAAISRIEAGGGQALLWMAGLPGSRLSLECRSGPHAHRLDVRGGRVRLTEIEPVGGPPSTVMRWWCSVRDRRRAAAWLRTALRFLPVPVVVFGQPVERGFRDGLYRMRTAEPLPAELAVTATGDAPTLWLLEHGVLSTRAVIPGYPAFSAAVEMNGVVPHGASGAELRSAVTPYLPRLIDEATRMLILLADRLPTVEETIRQRLTTLLLGSAVARVRKGQVMGLPLIPVRTVAGRRLETVTALGSLAAERGGVLTGAEGGSDNQRGCARAQVEAGPEELSLLTELTGVRVERRTGGHRPAEAGRRLMAMFGKIWHRLRALIGPRPLPPSELSEDEGRLIERAAEAGVRLALVPGRGRPRRVGSRHLVGRERAELVAVSRPMPDADVWLYPELIAITGEDPGLPEGLRDRWLEAMTGVSVRPE